MAFTFYVTKLLNLSIFCIFVGKLGVQNNKSISTPKQSKI